MGFVFCRLQCRKEKGGKKPDYGYYGQKFDQCE